MLVQCTMATEMGQYYTALTSDLGGKLSNYITGLEARYGDPRIYEMQRQQMAQQEE